MPNYIIQFGFKDSEDIFTEIVPAINRIMAMEVLLDMIEGKEYDNLEIISVIREEY